AITDEPFVTANNFVLYRLKMTDVDGGFSYSPVIKINFRESKAALSIRENPVVNGRLQFIITGLSSNKKAVASILDHNGRVVIRSAAFSLLNNEINVSNLS